MEEEKKVIAEFSSVFLTESEVAQFLHLSVRTLRTWRYRGTGPQWHSFGRAVRYPLDGLTDFVNESSRTSISDRGETKKQTEKESSLLETTAKKLRAARWTRTTKH